VQLVPNRRRVLAPGIGDTLARGFEWAATIAIFLGVGFVLDRILGTTPVFMVVLFVFALVGQISAPTSTSATRSTGRPRPAGPWPAR